MSAITSELDVGPLPEKAEIDAVLDLSDDGWRELVYPGSAGPESRN